MMLYKIPIFPLHIDVETKKVLTQLNLANKKLAELKGVALTISNEFILRNILTLQEAKDNSAIENIVTAHDDLYRANADIFLSLEMKEVLNDSIALKKGFELIKKSDGLLTCNIIKEIKMYLEENSADFRSTLGTTLKNGKSEIVYTPPQDKTEIENAMQNLETFINDASLVELDCSTKMAIIHHQFKNIHPCYDGNGRTGRIINILYLVCKDLLDSPILYLNRYVIANKSEHYHLLQKLRDEGSWKDWVIFILKGVAETSEQTIHLVKAIGTLILNYKQKIREKLIFFYRHELLSNLFNQPYTKINFVMEGLGIKRITATKYLNYTVYLELLKKEKIGKNYYYLNLALINLLKNPLEMKMSNSVGTY